MAKEKFDRSKPHVNVGTIGHEDHLIQLIMPLKKEKEVLQLLLLTLSTQRLKDIMHMWTVPVTQIMLKT